MQLKKSVAAIAIAMVSIIQFSFSQSAETPEMTEKEKRDALVKECKSYIGTPYAYGGVTRDGIDCSGLIMVTIRDTTGIQMPRKASEMYDFTRTVPDAKKQPGDLLFFKTDGSEISHVAVYIGKDQFIHAVSTGENTGVIVSSLKQAYWKPKYVGCGTIFAKSDGTADSQKSGEEEPTEKKSTRTEQSGDPVKVTTDAKELQAEANSRFPLGLDATALFNWNFWSPQSVMFNARGFSIQVHAQYNGWTVKPGIGFDFKGDLAMGIFQFPIYLTVSPIDYIRVYAGCVFTSGTPTIPSTTTVVKPSIFPGIIGISFQTPALQIRNAVGLRFVQDISYTVFNNTKGSALGPAEALSAGLYFQTGIRVDIYLPPSKKQGKK